jgi:hypothetical protein
VFGLVLSWLFSLKGEMSKFTFVKSAGSVGAKLV